MPAAKNKIYLAAYKANASSVSALEKNSGVESKAQTSRDLPQLNPCSSDYPSEPASCRPAPGNVFEGGTAAQGKLATQSSRQLVPTEGELAYGGSQARTPTTAKWDAQAPLNPLPSLRKPIGACHTQSYPGLCGMPDGVHVFDTCAPEESVPRRPFLLLPHTLCWSVARGKSLRLTFRHPAHRSERT
jgi:hypothetical protein